MQMSDDKFKLAVPITGRLAVESLEWLAGLGILEKERVARIASSISNFKKLSDEKTAKNAVQKEWKEGLEGITLRYDLRSGWRAAFSAIETKIKDEPVTIYGSESPTINGIREGLGEIAIIGYDDLFAAMLPYLDSLKAVDDLSYLNDAIKPNSTDVRLIGSTGQQDYAGLFLMTGKSTKVRKGYREEIRDGAVPVYVKGRYEGLLYYFLGNDVDARATEDVEEKAKSDNCFAFDLVRTGDTIIKKQMKLIGDHYLLTRAVIAVDHAKYSQNERLRNVVSGLKPADVSKDFEEGVLPYISKLEEKLGELWEK